MMKDKESLINLDIDLNNPIEIGSDIRSLGVPSWDLTFFMLSSYVGTHDVDLRQHLRTVLDLYEKVELSQEHFERTIRVMTDTSLIETIIKEDNPPSYEEAINMINEDVLNQYMVITNKDIDDRESLKQFITLTIEPIAFNLYSIYHTDQYNKYIKQVDFVQNKRMEYINNYKKADSTDERSRLQRELTKWETAKNRDQFMVDYQEKTYKSYDTERAIDVILAALEQSSNITRYELETLDSIIPEQNFFINNRLMQKLVSGEVAEGRTELIVSGSRQKEVITLIDIDFDDENIEIQGKDSRFTNDHRQVYNALATIWEAGNEFFTPSQVYRCMNGYSNTEKVRDTQIERITDLIDDNRRINGRIDFTEEARARNKEVDKYIVEDNIISAKKVTLAAGGTTVEGYKFNTKPILYEYAQISQQIYTVPSYILNTKDYIRSTPEVMSMKEYFIMSIEWMKSKNNPRSRNLTLESIYKELYLTDPSKHKAKSVRDNAAKILDSFIDKEYIKDYKFYKEGRSFKGIEIIL